MDELSKIGRTIAKIRQSQKRTQLDLALDMDMDRSYLSQIENGKENISIKTLVKIANSLGVELQELIPLMTRDKKDR